MNRINPTIAMVAAAILALVLVLYVFASGDTRSRNPDRLRDDPPGGRKASASGDRCSSPQAKDLIKAELLRQAVELGSTRSVDELTQIATSSLLRLESVKVARGGKASGTVRCVASMILDLPPGVALGDGRHSLAGEAAYALGPPGEASGTSLTLTGAEEIVQPLATLFQNGELPAVPVESNESVALPPAAVVDAPPPAPPRAPPRAPAARTSPPTERQAAAPTPPRAQPQPMPQANPTPAPARVTASPSFNCGNARTRGEIAVCSDGALSNLDRQMASHFYRARTAANPRQRALLERTRGNFLRFRDSCASQACMVGAYRDRMREIDDIMADRWNP